MSKPAPYHLYEPDCLSTNVVFNSPHSGRAYPAEFVERSRLDAHALRASEDAHVDVLYRCAPDHGAPLLAATAPRAWVDLNRGPEEFDPALIEGIQHVGLNQRIAAGLGVIPRIVSEGQPIYVGKIGLDEANARIRDVHTPYHAALEGLLQRARDRFGSAILFDCHSMPGEALRAAPRVGGKLPDVVLGDRFGASASRRIVSAAQSAFESQGFVVARNAPFAGGYITQRYGRPSRGQHAIQIEIDRSLYLDRKQLVPNEAFNKVRMDLEAVIASLVGIADDPMALAAE